MKELHVLSLECVAPVGAVLGESPLWDPRIASLVWTDIKGAKVFTYQPGSAETAAFSVPDMITAIGLSQAGGYVCATRKGFAKLTLNDGSAYIEPITEPEADRPSNRFNDGKADPSGGFWAGTMDDTETSVSGAWWRLLPDATTVKLADGVGIANGPAFDAGRSRVYLTDSAARTVDVARSDGTNLQERRLFLRFEESDGSPDGMEVDDEGCIWIAFWDGACIRRFSPDGEALLSIALPVPRPTSVAVVENRVYVTSASVGLDASELKARPYSGGLFEITLSRSIGRPSAAWFQPL